MTGMPTPEVLASIAEGGDANLNGPTRAFFANGKGGAKFVPKKLADRLAADTPVAVGGERLYVYRDGTYRPDGEADLRRRVAAELGDAWRKGYADETVALLRDSAPSLWERPPLDRINCRNGLLDLDTGRLEPHDPTFLSPVQIGAAFDPSATCPAIEQFVCEVLGDELVPLTYELAGYLAIPDPSLQVAVMLLGGGANGKSSLLNLYVALLGRANVSTLALHQLDEDRFACADLYGRLANVFADLDSRALRSSSIFKSITGGDAVRGERKFRSSFEFVPYARLLFSANEAPPTSDSSEAFFRRWLILPFERTFAPGERDPRLLDKLTTPAALSGLLNAGLAALPALRARGAFTSTQRTHDAAERFRVDADSAAGFLAECCDVDPDGRVERPTLYGTYDAWCRENNRRALSRQRFNHRLRELVPSANEVAVQGVRYWDGVRLLTLGERR